MLNFNILTSESQAVFKGFKKLPAIHPRYKKQHALYKDTLFLEFLPI